MVCVLWCSHEFFFSKESERLIFVKMVYADAVNRKAMIFKICVFFIWPFFSYSLPVYSTENDKLHTVRMNMMNFRLGDETPIDDSLYDYVKCQTISVMIYYDDSWAKHERHQWQCRSQHWRQKHFASFLNKTQIYAIIDTLPHKIGQVLHDTEPN